MKFKLLLIPVMIVLFSFIVLADITDQENNIVYCTDAADDFTADITNGTDFDGTAHTGAVITSTNCKIGDCWSFDGSSDVELPNTPLSGTQGTVSLWYRAPTATAWDWFIGNEAGTFSGGRFAKTNADKLNFDWGNAGDTAFTIFLDQQGSSLPNDAIHHMIYRWNTSGSGQAQIFKDGTLVITDTSVANLKVGITTGFFFGDSDGAGGADALLGTMDEIKIYNISLGDEDIKELNGTVGVGEGLTCSDIEAGPPITLQEFTLTARDTYDSTAITNITISISNNSFSFNDSTVNGTLIINNQSIPSFNKLYTITFGSNDTGGYFNNTFLNINISNAGSFQGTLFQSVLRLIALDALNNETISDFSARTNNSFDNTTTGELLILIKDGTFQLNVTALSFDKLVTSFSINALENKSLNVSMGSIFTFKLIREETNTPFEFANTNETKLSIFCPNQTITLIFNESNNISQIINCQFTLMQIVVDYGVLGSYFRTLIPPFSQKNVSFFLIDLINGDTAIQKVIKLLDLTGEFADSILTAERSIGGITEKIIEQRFDISSQVNLFLVKDALYTLSIENSNEDIILGNLIPTEAGEQTITLPKIDFVPQETTLGGNVSWSYTFNITSNILRLQYNDATSRTTVVRFTVFNATDTANMNQLFSGQSENNASVTITFNQAFANTTYATVLFVKHPDFTNFTEKKMFYQFKGSGGIDLKGWTPIEQTEIKNWVAWIFLAILGMLFSRRYTGIGMTLVVIFLWIFRKWNWIENVSDLVFGFVALLAVVGYIVDAMRKN